MDNIELSIIIPTYGRKKEVEELLDSILITNKIKEYEVIIVDQNKDLLDESISNYMSKMPINHIKVDFKGAAKARNCGLDSARGKYVCFPDDDAQFSLDTIEVALKEMDESQADVVFGKCVEKETGEDSVIKFNKKKIVFDLSNFENSFVEATMFAKKKILDEYRYDEELGVGTIHGAEEGYDLVYRMIRGGIKIVYSPLIIFYHPNKIGNRTTNAEVKRAFYYSCGFGYLCKKHRFKLKFFKRYVKLLIALPIVFVFKHKQYKYYMAQILGAKAGYCLPI